MKSLIYTMISTIQDYKHPQSELLSKYVQERLSQSFTVYSKELSQSMSFLERKHEKSILKRLNKIL